MPRPLQPGDPPRLGPFRLNARLRESAAGIVYLGEDPYGVHVSVALLTKGAAGDAAARDRFRAAIVGEMPASTGVPRRPGSWTAGATSPLIAAHPESKAPWVATVHDPRRPGAERFLDPVMFEPPKGTGKGEGTGVRAAVAAGAAGAGDKGGPGGPRFEPYWIGARDPAELPVAPRGPRLWGRGLVAALVTLAVLLALLVLALVMLFACEPPPRPQPTPSPVPSPSTGSPSPSPSPSPTRRSPSPSPSKTTRTPSPSAGTGSGGPV